MNYNDPFLEKHFAKRNKLREEIKKKGFGVEQGLKMSELDKNWWLKKIKTQANKKVFETAWADKVEKKLGKAKSGMDIPRGVSVEKLFYKIEKGYTDQDYAKHLKSYD